MGFVIPRARAPIATVRCSCKGVGNILEHSTPWRTCQKVDAPGPDQRREDCTT
jgi:hypothetical protein